MNYPRLLLLMTCCATLTCGCASSPQSRFYTLSAQSSGPPAEAPAPAPVTIVLTMVNVPEIVDRPQIVVRTSIDEVQFNEFDRWADSLKSQIRRVIVADLAAQFPGGIVYGSQGAVDLASAYQVSIEIQSFESAPADAAAISMLWSIRPPKGTSVNGRSVVHEPAGGPGYDMVVAAHSRALARASEDIAAAIRLNVQH
jgi:uncharacterized lipoprotein YmbA